MQTRTPPSPDGRANSEVKTEGSVDNDTQSSVLSPQSSPEPAPSMWGPLRNPVFRSIWIALIASNIGTWMQGVGAAWLMTSLTPSPLLVALMQTATSLPVFLVGLPAGTLADLIDRRKLLLVTQGWMLFAALALGLLTLAGLTSVWTLLTFTFLLGLGAALNGPAWQAVVPDLVERQELQAAVALDATGFNVARAAGPALGGIVVAAAGPAAVFLVNAASFLGVVGAIFRWRRAPAVRAMSDAPPEDMLGATVAGMRYTRHAPALQAVLVRTAVFIFGSSAVLALLPVVARQELGLDALGYGILFGSQGLGAVVGALFLPRVRRSLSIDALAAAVTVIYVGATLALAYLHFLPLLVPCIAAGGAASMTMLSSMTFATNTASPGWVRARALGIYLLVFQGMLAVGSFAWGALAQQFGNAAALTAAALVMAAGLAAALRWPLRLTQGIDLSPSGHWGDPRLAITPDPEDGPVLVTIEYRVPFERASDFLDAMNAMRLFRRREGAVNWGIFRDAADPDHYVETFLVLTWGEHMRQHARVTVEDQAIEARAFSFLQPGVEPFTSHLIDAHTLDGPPPTSPPRPDLSP